MINTEFQQKLLLSILEQDQVVTDKIINNEYPALDIYFQDQDGLNMLIAAAWAGNIDLVKFIIRTTNNNLTSASSVANDYYAQTTKDGKTALMCASMYAARTEAVAVVESLLATEQYKSLINHQDKYGQTALFIAVEHRRASIVECLIRYGADIKLADNHSRTVIDLAQQKGYADMLAILERTNTLADAKANTRTLAWLKDVFLDRDPDIINKPPRTKGLRNLSKKALINFGQKDLPYDGGYSTDTGYTAEAGECKEEFSLPPRRRRYSAIENKA